MVRFSHLNVPFFKNSELILFSILSPRGSSNYRPSAPFFYEVATLKTVISAIIIIIIIMQYGNVLTISS